MALQHRAPDHSAPSDPPQNGTTAQLLALGFDKAPTAAVIIDAGHLILHVNAGFSHLFGWHPEEARGHTLDGLLSGFPRDPQRNDNDIRDMLASSQPTQAEKLLYDRHGQTLWCKLSITPATGDNGERIVIGAITDITHGKIHEVLRSRVLQAMVEEKDIHETMKLLCLEIQRIAPSISATVMHVDDKEQLCLLASPDFPQECARELDAISIDSSPGSCATAASLGKPVLIADIEHDPCMGNIRDRLLPLGYKACWSSPIKARDSHLLGVLTFYYRQCQGPSKLHEQLAAVSLDLCALALEREEHCTHIHRLAYYDDLTGLPNRSMLRTQAEHALAQANRNGEQLAVLFVDLDRFKHVNDSLGHPAGDTLLRIVTRRLHETVRGADIISRLSGDEFVIMISKCNRERATELAKRLLTVLAAPCQIDEHTLSPAASIGISMFPDNGRDTETLLNHADMAMYQAKNQGRARFSFFSSEMNRIARDRIVLEAALRDALDNQQLELHYQPQINIENLQLHGVEALVRWHHPYFGKIEPLRFIPLAEESGLISRLSLWALRQACHQLAQWRRNGLNVPAVSVNLSPNDFHNLDLPRQLDAILRANALAPSDLVVEITESVVMDGTPSTLQTINDIHALGVRLAIDDFGTGYSNLGYLRRLPVSELKLDQSFVQELESDHATRALTNAVMHIGDSMELTVIAEGVEQPTQRNLLKAQGYQIVQGFLYSPALPAAQLENWIVENLSFTQWGENSLFR
ncbi:MAG: EAL domain-containing protein [Azoarcus sp.]|jgi:diguanylate cyclase (GGDEF)-like protein/PAS domain S-box-containing protein|nr:EAL domain-containing protein [Azoarcus sp.]